ncbi:hypothetical protein Javan59_0046 [Streptococcus phage Javan59]|uniref:DUF1642 domain-containing protein n=1 Tax=Streptococcus anginosus TaxID=1328 RepID=UPI00039190F8|nr:DUF1642 domain-containing protein [Streptococcus anginosus]QBX21775.1 hypothetical protein Javan59_0046 [Streptococcus phage Javan59]GAD41497.1 hypothetical protein ANG4_0091 [Streptococcus anginosus 1505]
MKYKLGDEVYLKGVITSVNSCAEINYPYEVKTADEFVLAAEQHLEPINKSELGHAEEAPRYLRNVLARLRELPEHDREAWLKSIMDEFELDFSHAKWREGYEQGKFDRAVEAEKSEVIIPQFVADWIEKARETTYNIRGAIEMAPNGRMKDWLELNNVNIFAEAWVNGYDVEQEKRYEVSIKASGQYLARTKLKEIKFMYNGACSHLTRKELEEAGFGWVFDCEGVEVREVE